MENYSTCTFYFLFIYLNKKQIKEKLPREKSDNIYLQALSTPNLNKPLQKPRKEKYFSPVMSRGNPDGIINCSLNWTDPPMSTKAISSYPPALHNETLA